MQVSLFERMQAAGVEPNMLQLQYRMHPSICAFPSLKFYDGRLASQPTAADRMPPKGDLHVSTRREYDRNWSLNDVKIQNPSARL